MQHDMQPAMPLQALPQQLQGVVPRRQVHTAVETWDDFRKNMQRF